MDIDEILSNSLSFKSKLGIGEEAYKSFNLRNNLSVALEAIQYGGQAGAFMQGATVAKVIGVYSGPLSIFSIGSIITPLPYVALAAVGSTIIYYGVMAKQKASSPDHLLIIPKFINTPLDLLAVSLFDLIAPLLYKIAISDGEFHQSERDGISNYFINTWGYSEAYVEKSFEIISQQINQDQPLKEMIEPFLKYINDNRDCNKDAIGKDLLKIFREIAEADGELKAEEKEFLEEANDFIAGENFNLWSAIEKVSSLFKRR